MIIVNSFPDPYWILSSTCCLSINMHFQWNPLCSPWPVEKQEFLRSNLRGRTSMMETGFLMLYQNAERNLCSMIKCNVFLSSFTPHQPLLSLSLGSSTTKSSPMHCSRSRSTRYFDLKKVFQRSPIDQSSNQKSISCPSLPSRSS